MTRNELVSSPEYWEEMISNQIYQLILQYKREKKVGIKALAQKAGVHYASLHRYLNGKHSMTIENLCKILIALEIAPMFRIAPLSDYLTTETDEHLFNPGAM